MLLHWDMAPIHISKAFKAWLKENFAQILITYVDANTTGANQLCDTVLNRPLKVQSSFFGNASCGVSGCISV